MVSDDEPLHLSRGGEFEECRNSRIEIIADYEDENHFGRRCDNCGAEMYIGDAGDIPHVLDGRILDWTYVLKMECMDCSNEIYCHMYKWRYAPAPHGPRYRPELQDNSRPGMWSPDALDSLETSEDVYAQTGRYYGHNGLHIRVAKGWKRLTAREIEDLLDTLKSYREEPDKWGGIHEINDALEVVIRAKGLYLRVDGIATAWINEEELDDLIAKIEWTECHCCNRKIKRVQLLKLHEKREAERRREL